VAMAHGTLVINDIRTNYCSQDAKKEIEAKKTKAQLIINIIHFRKTPLNSKKISKNYIFPNFLLHGRL